MAKYSALEEHLRERPAGEKTITITFDQIEEVLEDGLPRSSRSDRSWWVNSYKGGHVQAYAWLDSGWQVAKNGVDFEEGSVTFERTVSAEGEAPGYDFLWQSLAASQAKELILADVDVAPGGREVPVAHPPLDRLRRPTIRVKVGRQTVTRTWNVSRRPCLRMPLAASSDWKMRSTVRRWSSAPGIRPRSGCGPR